MATCGLAGWLSPCDSRETEGLADGWTSVEQKTELSSIQVGITCLLFCHELGHALLILLAGERAYVIIGSHDGR